MKKSCFQKFVLTVLILAACVTPVAGANIDDLSVYPFLQHFTWEEFDSNGTRLLKESGPLYGAGGDIKLSFLHRDTGALTFKGKLELFTGNVDYDGQTQAGTPITTDVDYFGITEEATVGWAFPLKGVRATVEPYTGLGYRWWLRDLNGPGGYTEEWSSLYLMLGARSLYRLSEDATFSVSGGAKYAFDNENKVDNWPGVGDITLEPGKAWSAQAEAGIKYKRFTASLYYENFVFPASPVRAGLYQPKSEAEIFGFRAGFAFK